MCGMNTKGTSFKCTNNSIYCEAMVTFWKWQQMHSDYLKSKNHIGILMAYNTFWAVDPGFWKGEGLGPATGTAGVANTFLFPLPPPFVVSHPLLSTILGRQTNSPKQVRISAPPPPFSIPSSEACPPPLLPSCRCRFPYCPGGEGNSKVTPMGLHGGLGSAQDSGGGWAGSAAPHLSQADGTLGEGGEPVCHLCCCPKLSPAPKQPSWSRTGAPLTPGTVAVSGKGGDRGDS